MVYTSRRAHANLKYRFGRLANWRQVMQIQEMIGHSLLGWYDALDDESFLLEIVVRKPVRLVIENGNINRPAYGGDPPAYRTTYAHRSAGARGRGVDAQTLAAGFIPTQEGRTRDAIHITACACSTVDDELARRVGSASRHPEGRR